MTVAASPNQPVRIAMLDRALRRALAALERLLPVRGEALVLGERLDPAAFLGMGLIGAGLAAIDGRAFRRYRPPA